MKCSEFRLSALSSSFAYARANREVKQTNSPNKDIKIAPSLRCSLNIPTNIGNHKNLQSAFIALEIFFPFVSLCSVARFCFGVRESSSSRVGVRLSRWTGERKPALCQTGWAHSRQTYLHDEGFAHVMWLEIHRFSHLEHRKRLRKDKSVASVSTS